MQQTESCEATAEDPGKASPTKSSLKKPKKKGGPVKCPPDAYIQRITCPTRLQFYKNLLQQELANTDRKILNASRCSSKLHHEVRFKKPVAADAQGDAPIRHVDEDEGGNRSAKRGRKGRVVRRLRHRKEISKFKFRDRSTSVGDRQVQANVDGCEAHCKVARKNSALYNINEGQKEHLKYGVFNKRPSIRPGEQTPARPNPILSLRRDEGKDRKVLHPQGHLRNIKPHRPNEASAQKKQVLKLSSSQIMHLDIKPKGVTLRRQLHCPLPLRKNIIRRNNRTAPHYVLFRRPSPIRQRYLNSVYRKGQCRRYQNAPLVRRVTPYSRSLNNRGRSGSVAPVKPPSNASSRNRILQLYRMVSPGPRLPTLPSKTKRLPNPNNAKPQNQSGFRNMHQPRVEKRPPQVVKSKLRIRSSSLQHASYYAPSNASPRHHSIPRRPRRILSARSIDGNGTIGYTRVKQGQTFISNRPLPARGVNSLRGNPSLVPPGVTLLRSKTLPPRAKFQRNPTSMLPSGVMLRNRPSMISSGPTPLRNKPSMLSNGVTSLRNKPSLLSSAPTSLRDKSSMYSSAPISLRDKSSMYSSAPTSLHNKSSMTSSGATSLCYRPSTSYQATIQNRSQAARSIPIRPTPLRQVSGPTSLRVRPPVPSRAQTSINTRPQPITCKRTSMRDLLNNLKNSSQRNLNQSLTNEHTLTMNCMANKNRVSPCFSLRPLRRSATLSGYYSCDVLPEKDEEETQNLERTASSNTTYTVPPEYCKLASISTQTLICQAERPVNITKNVRA